MTQHAVPSTPSRSVPSANAPSQAPHRAPDCKLLEGVAAQDALVALFDEFADEEPLLPRDEFPLDPLHDDGAL